jgi:hypothetical protein
MTRILSSAILAHAARNQLGVLRTGVEDQDAMGVDVGVGVQERRYDLISTNNGAI